MRNLWLHSISMGAEADNPLVVFRGASIDWASELITRRCFRSTWEFSESWFGSRFGGGTFSEFSEAPSLPPSQLILNFVTLRIENDGATEIALEIWSLPWMSCLPGIGGQYVALELLPKRRGRRSLSQFRFRVVNVHVVANTDEFWTSRKSDKSSLHQRYYTESVHSSTVEYSDNWPADLYEQVRRTTVTPTRSASGILSGFGGSAWASSIQEIFCWAITNNVNDLCKRHHKVSSCWEYLEDEHVSSLWHRPDIHSIKCLQIRKDVKL